MKVKSFGLLVPSMLVALLAIACTSTPASTPTATKSAAPPATVAGSTAAPTKAATPTAPPKVEKIRIGYTTTAGSFVPVWVAKEAGLYAKYGLEAEVQFVASGAVFVAALQAKEIDIASSGSAEAVQVALSGTDHVTIGSIEKEVGMDFFVVPSVQTAEDLKGKTIGVTRLGSATDFAARNALKAKGLNPDKDITVIQTGSPGDTVAAMAAGSIQGAVIPSPQTLIAKKAGMKELMEANLPYPSASLVTTKSYIKEHEDIVERFVKAVMEGVYKSKTDKAFTKKVIGQYTNTQDDEVLEETYNFYLNRWQKDLALSMSGMQNILDDLAATIPQAKTAKPQDFVDLRFIDKVKASGFIDQLYK